MLLCIFRSYAIVQEYPPPQRPHAWTQATDDTKGSSLEYRCDCVSSTTQEQNIHLCNLHFMAALMLTAPSEEIYRDKHAPYLYARNAVTLSVPRT